MEAVEDLVIGEEAAFPVLVHEPFMDGLVHWGELDIVSSQFLAPKDFLQSLLLLLAVRQNIKGIVAKEIVLQGLRQEFEVLVEKRLGCHLEGHHGRGIFLPCFRLAGCRQAKLNAGSLSHTFLELACGGEVYFLSHLTADALCLQLGSSLQLLREALGGESFLIDLLDTVVDKSKVLHHHQGILAEEVEERLLVGLQAGQLGHNLYLLPLVLRQLVLHVEGADGVYLVTEEVDAEGIFATVGIDVEDASPDGKLSRLIHIVGLLEAKLPQGMDDSGQRHLLRHGETEDPVVQVLLAHHQFCEGIGIGDDVDGMVGREACQHLGAENLIGSILLSVFHGAPVTGWKEESPLLPHHLGEVVVEIARLVGIVQHKQHRTLQPVPQGGEE